MQRTKIFNSIIFFVFVAFIYCQGVVTEINKYQLLKKEYEIISNLEIKDELFYSPFIQDAPQKKHFNIFKKLDYKNYFVAQPLVAFRTSSQGFGMYADSTLSLSSVNWITPGLRVYSTIPIMRNLSNIWVYSWFSIYKHSAYGFNNKKTKIIPDNPLFNYSSNYSCGYYEPTKKPKNGIDFDEGQAGISILSSNVQLIFGKFKTNIGPFYSGNLSISDHIPSFEQFLIKANYNKKLFFSYVIGSLSSNIPKYFNENMTNLIDPSGFTINKNIDIEHLFTDQWELFDPNTSSFDFNIYNDNKFNIKSKPMYERYVVNHRLDFIPLKNLRIGIYEQIIFGAKKPPFSYLIPINLFWSSQHSSNDQDNLQMGFDLEYIFSKYRLTLALLADEWALFDTFDSNDRNWFAYQFGFSRIFTIKDKKSLFKIEYTRIDPEVYKHRFIINEPLHHGYNIGFWSGGNSDNIFSNITVILNEKSFFKIEYEYTRIGKEDNFEILENQYNNNPVYFLFESYYDMKSIALGYSTDLIYDIVLDIDLINSKTDVYGKKKSFNDFRATVRYNISY